MSLRVKTLGVAWSGAIGGCMTSWVVVVVVVVLGADVLLVMVWGNAFG
jgi:membrane associated rhomboid family serine protease